MNVAERIKNLRKNNGFHQKEVAEKLGITLTGYASYEQGRNKPSYDSLLKLSELYNVSIDYLVGKTDIQYTDHEKEFADKISGDMSLEELLNKYQLTLDGKELTDEDSKKIIKLIKLYLDQD